MNYCFAIGLERDYWWMGQKWEFNFKVQMEQKIHGTTGNRAKVQAKTHSLWDHTLGMVASSISSAERQTEGPQKKKKRIFWVLVVGSEMKKNVLIPFKERIFYQEDSIHLLLL